MRTRTNGLPGLFNDPYAVRLSGHIGQVIVDADGTIVCWTCDGALAAVLTVLLNRVADGSVATCLPTEGIKGLGHPVGENCRHHQKNGGGLLT